MKNFTLIAYLLSICVCAQAQVIVSKNSLDHAYARNVKSLDEFIARFNGDEFHPDVPDDSTKRMVNILSLVNPEIKINGVKKNELNDYITLFAEKSSLWHGRLSVSSDRLWAMDKCEFTDGKSKFVLSILFQQERKTNGNIRWAIVGVSGLRHAGFYDDNYLSISPVDHELSFLSLEDLINHNRNTVASLRSVKRDIDELSMFLGLVNAGKISYVSGGNVVFYFLDLPGYIFTVSSSQRAEDVGAWMISDIIRADEFEKMDFINKLYGFN